VGGVGGSVVVVVVGAVVVVDVVVDAVVVEVVSSAEVPPVHAAANRESRAKVAAILRMGGQGRRVEAHPPSW
jgi:hypothetical protein